MGIHLNRNAISVRVTMSLALPKPKQLFRPITRDEDSPVNESEFKVIACNRRQARENAHVELAISLVLVFASHWLRKWREYCQPITEQSNAKPNETRISFDTQLKAALLTFIWQSIRSRAELSKDGKHYILNGGKLWWVMLRFFHFVY